jgi:hypothetical protein
MPIAGGGITVMGASIHPACFKCNGCRFVCVCVCSRAAANTVMVACMLPAGMLQVQWLQTHTHTFSLHTYTHAQTHTHTLSRTHAHTHMHACANTHTHTHTHTHTNTHTCSESMMGKSFVSIDGKVLCDPCACKEAVGGSATSCAACGTIYIMYPWYIMLPLVLPVVLYML